MISNASEEENVPAFDQYWDQSPIIKLEELCPTRRCHGERTNYAFVIYMNEQNIHGGTQFIRHTINGKEISNGKDETLQQDTTIRLNTPWDYEPWNGNNTIYPR